ncbi:MAG TPA: outer membrane beta-barrel protein [Ohtaekwangia sp.]|uniref:outer membrane beta-barrel protein n=1 Tax=Ohtaekwangia sp. TaxID=2066019 RepID=UPI002F931555
MESRKFEDAFKDAFGEAEVSPAENVWTNIELDLEKAEGDKMKRRILFYKLLAAASIAFAMSMAGVGYYILQDKQYIHNGSGIATLSQTNTAAPDESASEGATNKNSTNGQQASSESAQQTATIENNNENGFSASSTQGTKEGTEEGTRTEESSTSSANVAAKRALTKEANANRIAANKTNTDNAVTSSQKNQFTDGVKSENGKNSHSNTQGIAAIQKQAGDQSSSNNSAVTSVKRNQGATDPSAAATDGNRNGNHQTITNSNQSGNAVASTDVNGNTTVKPPDAIADGSVKNNTTVAGNNTTDKSQTVTSSSIAATKTGSPADAAIKDKNATGIDAKENADTNGATIASNNTTDKSQTVASSSIVTNEAGSPANVAAKDKNAAGIDVKGNADANSAAIASNNATDNTNTSGKQPAVDNISTQQQQQIAATAKGISDQAGNNQLVAQQQGKDAVSAGNSTVASRNGSNATQMNPFTNQDEIVARLNSTSGGGMQTASVDKLPTRVGKPADFDASKLQSEDPLMKLLGRLTEEDKARAVAANKDEQSPLSEKLWTSVGFAAGSFNTVNSSVSTPPSQSFSANNVAGQQAKASGSAYTVGVSMGTRLSERWVVQGGVNYMSQASDYTTNAASTSDFSSFAPQSVNSALSTADARVVSTAPYSVNNNMQFISVPVQAGYLIVNKKFGVQLNGGIATDMFLQNTLTPEGGGISKTTQSSGADSPYRTLNFSGLVGTELSYKFGQHYRLALNPGLRYPFNSIYKSNQPIAAMPLTFDVGLRFRYIFH